MGHVYQAWYVCKSKEPINVIAMLPEAYNVTLGLPGGNGFGDIIVKGTVGHFVVGQMYYIGISDYK